MKNKEQILNNDYDNGFILVHSTFSFYCKKQNVLFINFK